MIANGSSAASLAFVPRSEVAVNLFSRLSLRFLLHHPALSPLRVWALRQLNRLLAARNLSIVSSGREEHRADALERIARVRGEASMVLLDSEAYSIYRLAGQTAKVEGAIAEFGVFQGGSARLLCDAKGGRDLHLFDTFAGLPATGEHDPTFAQGGFAGSREGVEKLLRPFPGVHIHEGFFPASAQGLEHLRFSFVHMDVDLYESTANGLLWFYPRLERGGVLISHDYDSPGVRKAFAEFFAAKPECYFELSGNQVAFVKL